MSVTMEITKPGSSPRMTIPRAGATPAAGDFLIGRGSHVAVCELSGRDLTKAVLQHRLRRQRKAVRRVTRALTIEPRSGRTCHRAADRAFLRLRGRHYASGMSRLKPDTLYLSGERDRPANRGR